MISKKLRVMHTIGVSRSTTRKRRPTPALFVENLPVVGDAVNLTKFVVDMGYDFGNCIVRQSELPGVRGF